MDVNSKVIPFELLPMGLIEVFSRLGADINLLLKDTGIPRSLAGSAGDHRGVPSSGLRIACAHTSYSRSSCLRISYVQQQQLIRNAIQLCRTPGLGLLAGMHIDWSYYGSVGSVLNCSPSLKDAGAALRRFFPIAQPHYHSPCHGHLSRQPDLYIERGGIIINPLLLPTSAEPEVALFETELILATTLRLYDQCGNKNVPNRTVTVLLNYPEPRHVGLYHNLPCHDVVFDAGQTAIACHYAFLTTPWRELRAPIYRRVIEQCEAEFSQSCLPQSFAAKVRWHISLHYNQPVTLEQIADQLALSPRMLTRRLAAEGTGFRQIVHQQRMELTALHLRCSSLSVDEVAGLMRFSSPSSLRRAIKSWSGHTAGRLRNVRETSGARTFARHPSPVLLR